MINYAKRKNITPGTSQTVKPPNQSAGEVASHRRAPKGNGTRRISTQHTSHSFRQPVLQLVTQST